MEDIDRLKARVLELEEETANLRQQIKLYKLWIQKLQQTAPVIQIIPPPFFVHIQPNQNLPQPDWKNDHTGYS